MPPEASESSMHASLISGGISLFASELIDPEGVAHGNAVYLCINSENKEEVKTFFEKLSAEARFISPLQDTPWGAFGVITDRFGFGWYLNYEVKTKA
jgi:PhnB protein